MPIARFATVGAVLAALGPALAVATVGVLPASPVADGVRPMPPATVRALVVDRLTSATTGGAWAAAPVTVSATVYDSVSGRTVTLHPGLRAYAASTIKVPILLTALGAARSGNTAASHALAADAVAMIERSDNTAATAIWRAAGHTAAVLRFTNAVPMTATASAPVLFLPWDGVRTSSADLVTLLRAMVAARSPITRADATYAFSLMGSVEPDQAWGVSAGVRTADRVTLKNGWVPVAGRGWTVNTMGIVASHGKFYVLAVTSTNQRSLAAGIAAVEAIARQVAAHLG